MFFQAEKYPNNLKLGKIQTPFFYIQLFKYEITRLNKLKNAYAISDNDIVVLT